MDFAFFNGLKRTTGMPPPDPWMSGETINYYYFGYLMFADLGAHLRPADVDQLQPLRRHGRRSGPRRDRRRRARDHAALGLRPARRRHVVADRQPRRLPAVPREGNRPRHGLLALLARGREGRHDQRVPLLQHHPRRPAPAFHGAAGGHLPARHPARRAPLSVAPGRAAGRRVASRRAVASGDLRLRRHDRHQPLGAARRRAGRAAARRALAAPVAAAEPRPPAPAPAHARHGGGRLRSLPALLSPLHPADRRTRPQRDVHRSGLLRHRAHLARPSSSPSSAPCCSRPPCSSPGAPGRSCPAAARGATCWWRRPYSPFCSPPCSGTGCCRCSSSWSPRR